MKIEKTVLGGLWTVFFPSPICQIEIETTTGRREVFRLPPTMAEAAFLFSPCISKPADWSALFGGTVGLEQIARFRLLKNDMVGVFQKTLVITASSSSS